MPESPRRFSTPRRDYPQVYQHNLLINNYLRHWILPEGGDVRCGMRHTWIYRAGEASGAWPPLMARRIFFIASVSPVRPVPTTESGRRSGRARLPAIGAGAMEGRGSSVAAVGDGAVTPASTRESEPGRAATDPAKAGPGVIATRAGAGLARVPAGCSALGGATSGEVSTGSLTSTGAAAATGSADADGVVVSAKCVPITSAAAAPNSMNWRPPMRGARLAVGRGCNASSA